MKTAIIFASQKGSTAEIAERVQNTLQEHGFEIDFVDTGVINTLQPIYDAILLLSPIYKGLWLPQMNHFLRRNREVIGNTPIWGLFPCIRVLEQSGKQYAMDYYLPQQMADDLNLVDVRFVAGKLVRREISIEEATTLNERYDGLSLAKISGDYRDWDEIHEWVNGVATQLKQLEHRPTEPSSEKFIID